MGWYSLTLCEILVAIFLALKVKFLFLNVPREGGPPALELFLKNTIFFTKSGQQVLKKVFAKWSQTYPTVKKNVFYQTWGMEVFKTK